MTTMTTIKHGRATFIVKPEHAQAVHDTLSTIDKSKGKRGAKLIQPKGVDKHHSMKRAYPQFNSRVMLTSDYVTAYTALNHGRLHLVACDFSPAVNRTPPCLDLAYPEVVEETNE